MPIYAYRCEGCGFQKDALQKLSDPPLVDCPECGQPKMVKQVTAAGFALKGSGWYVTDFRDQGKKSTSSSDSAASSTSASGDTGTSSGSSTGAATSASGDSKTASSTTSSSSTATSST